MWKIIEMATDMDIGVKKLAEVASKDPVLSLKNSYYGQFSILWSQPQDRQYSRLHHCCLHCHLQTPLRTNSRYKRLLLFA